MTLQEKYNYCLALNIELEEIIEMQNIELQKKNKYIEKIELENLRLETGIEELEGQNSLLKSLKRLKE